VPHFLGDEDFFCAGDAAHPRENGNKKQKREICENNSEWRDRMSRERAMRQNSSRHARAVDFASLPRKAIARMNTARMDLRFCRIARFALMRCIHFRIVLDKFRALFSLFPCLAGERRPAGTKEILVTKK